MFGVPCPGKVLTQRVSLYVHAHTLYWPYRPFGTAPIFATHDDIGGLGLYMIEPSGQCHQYFACASGRGRQTARTDLEK